MSRVAFLETGALLFNTILKIASLEEEEEWAMVVVFGSNGIVCRCFECLKGILVLLVAVSRC